MSQSDGRIAELVAEFQRMTEEAYKNGELPTTVFAVQYKTENVTSACVWQVPDLPHWSMGSGKEVKP